MDVKSNSSSIKPVAITIFTLMVLVFLSFLLNLNGDKKESKGKKEEKLEIEKPTQIKGKYSFIEENRNKIHQDETCSIYLDEDFGVPTLYYVYEDELTAEESHQKFFLHIFLKDPSKVKKNTKSNYLNLDFQAPSPIETQIDNKTYFIFKRPISYKQLELSNILYINTGRYNQANQRTYNIQKIKIGHVSFEETSKEMKKIALSVSKKNYEKIKQIRTNALDVGILISGDDDFVKAKLSTPTSDAQTIKMRLKGDWSDHLVHPKKWSYRVIMDGEDTYQGMRKFSIQHPSTRNFLWEWIYHKTMRANDLIGLRYDFAQVDINIETSNNTQKLPLGIMAIEESFDKILIENNRRREGIIIALDESLLWNDRAKQQNLGQPKSSRSRALHSPLKAPIKLFNESKVLANPSLAKQFETAKGLLDGLRKGQLKISEVFDMDRLTTFVALSNLFGGQHGLLWHNLRVYYNPITNKLEPIAFDSDSGQKVSKIIHYPFAKEDPLYHKKLVEKFELVTSSSFIQNIIDEQEKDLSFWAKQLKSEFKKMSLDISVLEHNSNFIKKQIFPSDNISVNFLNFEEGSIELSIQNLSDYPVIINSLNLENGKVLNTFLAENEIGSKGKKSITFPLKETFSNAFVSKKNKEGGFRYPKDLKKIKVNYSLAGSQYERYENIIPFNLEVEEDFNQKYKASFRPNFKSLSFIEVIEDRKVIKFKKGKHILNKSLVIPTGHKVVIEAGCHLEFRNKASLTSYSPIIAKGTKTNPIKFQSSNSSGAGVFVTTTKQKSILTYCHFVNLSNPKLNNWSLSGAVNFHEAEVEIAHCVFRQNRCEDGLNIIRSNFSIRNSVFKDTQSDAFDGDFVKGRIVHSQFINAGNDGIDVSGSNIDINHIIIKNPADKAISGGEASKITGKNVKIRGGEIGLVSKDLSTVTISNVDIQDTRLAFSCFQKKSEFGPGLIQVEGVNLTNIEVNHLVEYASNLSIDKEFISDKVNNITEKMYGNEYGKSSR